MKKTYKPREAFTCTRCQREMGARTRRGTFRGQKYCWPCIYSFLGLELAMEAKSRGTEAKLAAVKAAPKKGE